QSYLRQWRTVKFDNFKRRIIYPVDGKQKAEPRRESFVQPAVQIEIHDSAGVDAAAMVREPASTDRACLANDDRSRRFSVERIKPVENGAVDFGRIIRFGPDFFGRACRDDLGLIRAFSGRTTVSQIARRPIRLYLVGDPLDHPPIVAAALEVDGLHTAAALPAHLKDTDKRFGMARVEGHFAEHRVSPRLREFAPETRPEYRRSAELLG